MKRRKLAEIEDSAMTEEDPGKLAQLFEQYRKEYLEDRGNDGEQKSMRKKQENPGDVQGAARGSQDPTVCEEMSIDVVECMDLWEHLEKIPKKDGTGKTWDHSNEKCWKTMEERDDERPDDEYAWDVNDIALPLDMVKESPQGRNGLHERENLQDGQKGGGLEGDGQSPDQHQVGWIPTRPTALGPQWQDQGGWPATSRTLRRRTARICSVPLRRLS